MLPMEGLVFVFLDEVIVFTNEYKEPYGSSARKEYD